MNKITFKDYPDTTTPLNANNLNQLQTNVENAIEENKTSIENIENNVAAIEDDILSINSNITNIETNVNDLTNRVTTTERYKGIATYGDGFIDASYTTEPFVLTQIGTPNQSFYFVLTFFFSVRTATASRTQIAIPYNYSAETTKNTVYIRYYIGGWSTWRLINS